MNCLIVLGLVVFVVGFFVFGRLEGVVWFGLS